MAARGKFGEFKKSTRINMEGISARAPDEANHVMIGRYVGGADTNVDNRPDLNTQSTQSASMNFHTDAVYSSTAMYSWDGLFRPVSKAGDGDLPQLINKSIDCLSGNSRQADPPIRESDYAQLEWSVDYLDPLANFDDVLPDERDNAVPASGHDIEIVGRHSTAPISGWTIVESEEGGVGGYATDYRFFAWKGPIVVQSWGRDKAGKPVPNAADVDADAKAGTFVSTDLEDKFLDNWLQKPGTWPVAPLDLVLDRERGVWTMPQPPRIIHALVSGCIEGRATNSGTGSPTNLQPVYDGAGTEITDIEIDYEWPWGIDQPTGLEKIPIYYDTVDCKHYAFPVNKLDVEGVDEDDIPVIVADVKTIIFGSGITISEEPGDGCNTIAVEASGGGSDLCDGTGEHWECDFISSITCMTGVSGVITGLEGDCGTIEGYKLDCSSGSANSGGIYVITGIECTGACWCLDGCNSNAGNTGDDCCVSCAYSCLTICSGSGEICNAPFGGGNYSGEKLISGIDCCSATDCFGGTTEALQVSWSCQVEQLVDEDTCGSPSGFYEMNVRAGCLNDVTQFFAVDADGSDSGCLPCTGCITGEINLFTLGGGDPHCDITYQICSRGYDPPPIGPGPPT
jgi:hypothetical protein